LGSTRSVGSATLQVMRIHLVLLVGSLLVGGGGDGARAEVKADGQAVTVYRDGLRATLSYVEAQPRLFPAAKLKEQRLLGRQEREAVWGTWQTLLDYTVALDAIGKRHRNCWRLKGAAQWESFQTGYAAFLAQYRFATDFFVRAGNDPWLAVLLDEEVPELGLPKGTYSKLRDRFLNGGRGAEFASLDAVYKAMADRAATPVQAGLEEDRQALWKLGRGKGQVMTARNAVDFVRRAGFTVYLPVQTEISEWMGDTKVARHGRSLISAEQIAALPAKLEPGDILLERREWYVSNAGLPGFWPHAALYIGTVEERRQYFGDDKLETELQQRYPGAYATSRQAQEHGHRPRVIEAISEGVSFTTLEHSADCDSLAVLRPRLSKAAKAAAILKAFHYSGRPYDFNFDFRTDATLVCTELVYKSYEGSLNFGLVEMLGRPLLPANQMVKQFAAEFGTAKQQSDLVLFLDGRERERRAVAASAEEFCASWKRPKWHILVKSVKLP